MPRMSRLYWVGPATVAAAVGAVAVTQRIAVVLVKPLPPAFRFPMLSAEPLVITAVLVTAAVIGFAIISDGAVNPIRTFRRIAAGVLLVSFVPNIAVAVSWGENAWRPAVALAAMHVVAWAVTVTMLTRLTSLTGLTGRPPTEGAAADTAP